MADEIKCEGIDIENWADPEAGMISCSAEPSGTPDAGWVSVLRAEFAVETLIGNYVHNLRVRGRVIKYETMSLAVEASARVLRRVIDKTNLRTKEVRAVQKKQEAQKKEQERKAQELKSLQERFKGKLQEGHPGGVSA